MCVLKSIISDISQGLLISGELARLDGLVHLGDMIFISRSYGFFYLKYAIKPLQLLIFTNVILCSRFLCSLFSRLFYVF